MEVTVGINVLRHNYHADKKGSHASAHGYSYTMLMLMACLRKHHHRTWTNWLSGLKNAVHWFNQTIQPSIYLAPDPSWIWHHSHTTSHLSTLYLWTVQWQKVSCNKAFLATAKTPQPLWLILTRGPSFFHSLSVPKMVKAQVLESKNGPRVGIPEKAFIIHSWLIVTKVVVCEPTDGSYTHFFTAGKECVVIRACFIDN